MSFTALQFGYKAIYNDLRSDLCLFFFYSLKESDLPFKFCERDEFIKWCKVLKTQGYEIFISEYGDYNNDFKEILSIKKVIVI